MQGIAAAVAGEGRLSMDGYTRAKREQARVLAALIRDYEWVHLSLGLFGNVCFFAGSVLFFLSKQDLASWFFVFGAAGMLIGSIGSAMVRWHEHRRRERQQGGSGWQTSGGEKHRV